MDSRVSVIIPTYNRPRWLRLAIESALRQTHPSIEVVVVDDGSATDAAHRIACSYPAVRYIFQENRGLGPARNMGLENSTSEYVGFLDDDDWLAADSVALRLLELEARPEAGLVYSDLYLATADGSVIGRYYAGRRQPLPIGDIYPALLRRNFIPVHAVLWRRTILEAVGGFPAGAQGVEDWYVLVRAAEQSSAHFVDRALGYYRLHDANMSLVRARQMKGAALTQAYIADSARFTRLPAAFRARVLTGYATEQWLDGDEAFGRRLLHMAQDAAPASVFPVIMQTLMRLGRPRTRWLMRQYWRVQAGLRKQTTPADYFLRRA